MQTTALVQFGQSASVVTTSNKWGTTVRLMTAKEFKTAKGIKGQDARRQYNDYIKEHGKANTAALAAALTSGELLVRSARDSKSSVGVNFIKASSLKAPAPVVAAQPTIEDACAMLGITVADFEAFKLAKGSK
jgi:hypothetical protein